MKERKSEVGRDPEGLWHQSFFSSSVSSSDCAPFCMSFSSVEDEEGRTSCSPSSVFLLVLSCTNSWISSGSRRNLSWYSWSRSFWSCGHTSEHLSSSLHQKWPLMHHSKSKSFLFWLAAIILCILKTEHLLKLVFERFNFNGHICTSVKAIISSETLSVHSQWGNMEVN